MRVRRLRSVSISPHFPDAVRRERQLLALLTSELLAVGQFNMEQRRTIRTGFFFAVASLWFTTVCCSAVTAGVGPSYPGCPPSTCYDPVLGTATFWQNCNVGKPCEINAGTRSFNQTFYCGSQPFVRELVLQKVDITPADFASHVLYTVGNAHSTPYPPSSGLNCTFFSMELSYTLTAGYQWNPSVQSIGMNFVFVGKNFNASTTIQTSLDLIIQQYDPKKPSDGFTFPDWAIGVCVGGGVALLLLIALGCYCHRRRHMSAADRAFFYDTDMLLQADQLGHSSGVPTGARKKAGGYGSLP